MMDCRLAREKILEAEPAELEAIHQTELGWHLDTCADCRAAVARVLEGMAVLDDIVTGSSRRTADAALSGLWRARAGSRRRMLRLAAAPAAAVLAALALISQWRAPLPPIEPMAATAPDLPLPVVEEFAGAGITVFATRNPRIVVVWINQEENR